MDKDHIQSCFSLGVKVAEHVHGIRRTGNDKSNDATFAALKAIVNGDLTLMDTPEEAFANLPIPPPGLSVSIEKEFYEMMQISRENERIMAGMVLKALPQ